MHKFWESWPVLYQKTSLYLSVKRPYFLEFMLAIRFQMCVCAHDLIRKTRTFLGMSERQPLLPLILPPGSSTNDVTAPLNLSFEHRQATTESFDHWKAGRTKTNIFSLKINRMCQSKTISVKNKLRFFLIYEPKVNLIAKGSYSTKRKKYFYHRKKNHSFTYSGIIQLLDDQACLKTYSICCLLFVLNWR